MTAPSPRARAQQPLFIPSSTVASGQRYALYHPPADGGTRGSVVYVHPFGEEMNKSRRMAAWQSRQLAQAGFAVLQPDLYGCGDSSGNFGDARWEDWLEDIAFAATWLRARHPGLLHLWGLRAGCLLALAASDRIGQVAQHVLWQPVTSGKTLLQQFLRQRLAADLKGSTAKATMDTLRSELAAGRSVEISGYQLSAALASGIESASLALPQAPTRVSWLDVSSREDATLAPAAAAWVDRWRAAGHEVTAQVVTGPSFWQTAEIEDAPRLIDATTAEFAGIPA